MLVSAERYVNYQWRYGILTNNGGVTDTTQGVNDVSAYGYVCADGECTSSSGTLWNGALQSTANSITLTYPTVQATHGYGVFFVKEGYIPYEVTENFYGTKAGESMQNPDGPYLFYLLKKESCRADLGGISTSVANNVLTFSVNVSAPFSNPSENFDYIKFTPSTVSSHYQSDVQLNIQVLRNGVVFADTLNLEMDASSSDIKTFSVPVTPGVYTVKATSSVPDNKCLASQSSVAQTTVTVTNVPPIETVPTLSIVSPRPITYATNSVLVELDSVNATDVWFEWNGSRINYTAPRQVTFSSGVHTLTAYASNSAGVAVASVDFNIQPELNDTTPPGPIANLHLVSKGTNFISWGWSNPSDSDFAQSIIVIDGVNVANTSETTYSISNLAANSTHTISITTKDMRGNVNGVAVSNTQTTLVENISTNDTLAPGPVSNLRITNKGKHFMSWAWNNPSDSDFAFVTLLLNGAQIANTSASGFSQAGLVEDTSYTLCAITRDFNGNINNQQVCVSGRTDKDSDNNDNDSDDDDNRKRTVFPQNEVVEDEFVPFVEEEENLVLNAPVKKPVSLLIVLLLLAVFLLLLIILLVLMRRAFEASH